jgi:hypothetical protein
LYVYIHILFLPPKIAHVFSKIVYIGVYSVSHPISLCFDHNNGFKSRQGNLNHKYEVEQCLIKADFIWLEPWVITNSSRGSRSHFTTLSQRNKLGQYGRHIRSRILCSFCYCTFAIASTWDPHFASIPSVGTACSSGSLAQTPCTSKKWLNKAPPLWQVDTFISVCLQIRKPGSKQKGLGDIVYPSQIFLKGAQEGSVLQLFASIGQDTLAFPVRRSMTPESWAQILKNSPNNLGTRRFIPVATRVRHWFLPWARPIQSSPPNPIPQRLISIFSPSLHLYSYIHSSYPHSCHTSYPFHPRWVIIPIIFCEANKLRSFLHSLVTSSLLGSNTDPQATFLSFDVI